MAVWLSGKNSGATVDDMMAYLANVAPQCTVEEVMILPTHGYIRVPCETSRRTTRDFYKFFRAMIDLSTNVSVLTHVFTRNPTPCQNIFNV